MSSLREAVRMVHPDLEFKFRLWRREHFSAGVGGDGKREWRYLYLFRVCGNFKCQPAASVPTFCDPMDCSMPGLPVYHQLLEFAQTHVHRVGDAIQRSCLLLSPFPYPQSFPASGSFPVSQSFTSGGQSIGVSASVFPMNIQDWFSLRLTGLIPLLSMGLSRVFSSTRVQKHQFFGTQPFFWSNSHIHTWLVEKP